MNETHYFAYLYWRAYRLYKAAMLKDLRSGYTNGAEVAAAARNWDTWYHIFRVRTGMLPPPPPCH